MCLLTYLLTYWGEGEEADINMEDRNFKQYERDQIDLD